MQAATHTGSHSSMFVVIPPVSSSILLTFPTPKQSPPDVLIAMKAAKKAGLKVFRTWAFNEKNATYTEGGLPMYGNEGAGPSEVFFQSWENGKATINYGPYGLQALDKVVALAEETGLKLIMALTNNWADYGGMDVYTINLGGKYHDDFYHVPKIVNAFKEYVKVVVNRYKDSPAIFAWELANEPRCGADGTRNLPRSAGENCTYVVMDKWMADMGKFIKNIDQHHMVTWGGEGEFHDPSSDDWAYAGSDGGNFLAELAMPEMDFGTFHLYPDWWSKTVEWSNQWVIDHGKAQAKIGKPVLFEEYGWLLPEDRLAWLGKTAAVNETRVAVLSEWQATSLQYKMSDMYWQFGICGLSFGCSTDDGFTIFLNSTTESKPLIYQHAAAVNAINAKLH
jgi:mannan endo-1,4-beta-mannosidase